MCCHVAVLGFSVGVGAFVIGLSQISSFFSLTINLFEICPGLRIFAISVPFNLQSETSVVVMTVQT